LVSKCPLTASLEYFDENVKLWRTYTSLNTANLAGQDEHSFSTFTNSFVTNFVSVNTGYWDISISEANALNEWDGPNSPHTEVLFRSTWRDPYSDELTTYNTTGSTVSDEYVVTIMDKCTLNELTMTESLGVLLQYVDHTSPSSNHVESSAYSINFSATLSATVWPNCVITHTLEFYDYTTQLWVDYATN
jgi:hypothetical protein